MQKLSFWKLFLEGAFMEKKLMKLKIYGCTPSTYFPSSS